METAPMPDAPSLCSPPEAEKKTARLVFSPSHQQMEQEALESRIIDSEKALQRWRTEYSDKFPVSIAKSKQREQKLCRELRIARSEVLTLTEALETRNPEMRVALLVQRLETYKRETENLGAELENRENLLTDQQKTIDILWAVIGRLNRKRGRVDAEPAEVRQTQLPKLYIPEPGDVIEPPPAKKHCPTVSCTPGGTRRLRAEEIDDFDPESVVSVHRSIGTKRVQFLVTLNTGERVWVPDSCIPMQKLLYHKYM